MIAKLSTLAALTIGGCGALPTQPAPAEPAPVEIVRMGEYQTSVDIDPPAELWVYFDPQRSAADALAECDRMGGYLATDAWRGSVWNVCVDVDY